MLNDLLRRLLGYGDDTVVKAVEFASKVRPVFLVLLIAAALAFVVYLYRREVKLRTWQRVLLGSFRMGLYVVLLLILFQPVAKLDTAVTLRRDVLVLFDASKSMNIRDDRARPEELANAALAVGKAEFVEPEQQRALARAMGEMRNHVDALRAEDQEAMLQAQAGVEGALRAVIEAKENAVSRAGDERLSQEEKRAILELVEIERRQKALDERITTLRAELALTPDKLAELQKEQEGLLEKVVPFAEKLASAPVPLASDVKAAAARTTRLEMAKGLVTHDRTNVFEQLAERYNVRMFTFGDHLEPAVPEGQKGSDALAQLKAEAESTQGGTAVDEVVRRYSGQPIAGVVLITDGAFNEGLDALSVARHMKEWGVPIYPIGLGLSAPDDVDVRSLIVQDGFFPKDIVAVRVEVFSHGYEGRRTTVEVTLDGDLMGRKEVSLSGDPQFIEIPFEAPSTTGASANLVVSVDPMPGEATMANNKIERAVRVLKEKIKVLYVEGKPRWEYRYLRAVLLRDRRLDVKFLMTQGDRDLATASDLYLSRYPEDPKVAFKFDLVILGDVPAQYFTTAQLKRMEKLVRERGGSLLMLAGFEHAPVSYVDTPIASLLPVQITNRYEDIEPDVYPVPTALGRRSLARLDPVDQENARVWSRVKPLYQVPRLTGAPAANVMIELPAGPTRPKPYPLVAWQYAGSGKVMYVGTDQLWRLRFKRGDFYHARFWGQAIQFLALSRLLGEDKRIRIETDRTEYLAHQRAEINVTVLDEFYQPVEEPQYVVYLERPDSGAETVKLQLKPVAGTTGLYQGFYTLEHAERHEVRSAPEDERYSNVAQFTVKDANREQLEPAMQEDLLRKMAAVSGGQYFSVSEVPALAGAVTGRERTIHELKDEDLWDGWGPYALLMLFGGLEWFYRRRFYLI